MNTLEDYDYNHEQDWTAINEQARAFAENFLRMVEREDLAEYFGSDRKAGIVEDWKFYFDEFSSGDRKDVAFLQLTFTAKKRDEPNESQSDEGGKTDAIGLRSRILSAFRKWGLPSR